MKATSFTPRTVRSNMKPSPSTNRLAELCRRRLRTTICGFITGEAMEYVNLGRSGLKVSRLCLGMVSYGASAWRPWVKDQAESRPFIRRALDLGVTFFDTADMYSDGGS